MTPQYLRTNRYPCRRRRGPEESRGAAPVEVLALAPVPDRVTAVGCYDIDHGASLCTQPLDTPLRVRLVTRPRAAAGSIGPAACGLLDLKF